jgi:Fe-S-cluster containining protein
VATSDQTETTNPQPWFAPGLSFTCTQCGNCCTGAPGFIWVDEAELRAIAEFRGVSYGEVKYFDATAVGERTSLREYANGDCIYLDAKSRRCTIYPVRPKQCRTWPFWNSNLASPESWQAVQQICPGADHGAFVPLEKIRQLAAEIDL